jgi:hypothetical protein
VTINQGAQQTNTISITTGIKNDPGITCFAYPNPVNTNLQIEVNKPAFKNLTYTLADINGRVLLSTEILERTTQINLSNYAKSTYILRLLENGKTINTFKITKK